MLGYLFGRNLPRLVHYIGRVSLLLALLIALVAVVVFLWRWFTKNRSEVSRRSTRRWQHAAATPRMSQFRASIRARGSSSPAATRRVDISRFISSIGFVISLAVIGDLCVDHRRPRRQLSAHAVRRGRCHRLHESARPRALSLFTALSKLGGRGAMTLLLFVGGFIYALRRQGLELAGWCAAFIGGALLDAALRFVVRRSELPFADIVLLDWGTGLASGHALGVLVGYGMLAYLRRARSGRAPLRSSGHRRSRRRWSPRSRSARLYLGQHYISDAPPASPRALSGWRCASPASRSRARRWRVSFALDTRRWHALASRCWRRRQPFADRRLLGHERGIEPMPVRVEQIAPRENPRRACAAPRA